MGTTLTGTTPQDTYDSLIKVTDNGPLSGSLKTLTDGLGNDSALALSTGAASVTGTLAVSGLTTLTASALSLRVGNATGNSGANILIAGASTTKNWSLGVQQNVGGALEFTPTTTNGATTLGTTPAMVILDAGNVGIGTSSPTENLAVSGSGFIISSITSTGNSSRGYLQTSAKDGSGNTVVGLFGSLADSAAAIELRAVTNHPLIVKTNNTEVARFLAGGGLTFNGDTAAANALDDYEEGTFTPFVYGTSTAGTATYAFQNGRYTKIGRLVHFEIYLKWSSGTGSGSLGVGGLPFTAANSSTFPSCSIAYPFNLTLAANSILYAHVENNATTIVLGNMVVGGSTAGNVVYDDAADILLSGTYSV